MSLHCTDRSMAQIPGPIWTHQTEKGRDLKSGHKAPIKFNQCSECIKVGFSL